MGSNSDYLLIVVCIGLFFALLSVSIILFVIYYHKKRREAIKDKDTLIENFNKTILETQLEIQEQTFNYISQEIHDNVGQILSLAKVQINIMNESEYISKDMLNEVKENVSKAMADLRNISKSLSSERIRLHGIYETVAMEAANINNSGVIKVVTSLNGAEQKMDEQKKLILFRIIQESLQNCIKHAHASEVTIDFSYLPDVLQVLVRDNGKGFDEAEIAINNKGLGLLNIKNRAALTGGSGIIASELNKGTTVTIKIPYE
ncbi:sensor histidine kinase [Ferruginibacter albus]|uniref:sensor histidine kinase n=1 Tax=Ferruginibacter albus TaxID=2875540 RepID=UPI001CC7762D|nr:ATP-binding protein [Ferruginibacter albus]UAY52634.1 hypothetical protein K9M53_02825 [Ferruginibacter albus]